MKPRQLLLSRTIATLTAVLCATAVRGQDLSVNGKLSTTPSSAGVLFGGALGSANPDPGGAGNRMFWYPGKGAFRVGGASDGSSSSSGGAWDDANIGQYSFGAGFNSRASGFSSISIGNGSTSLQSGGIAIGWNAISQTELGLAIGYSSWARGLYASLALGWYADSSGLFASALGANARAGSEHSTALGYYSNASSNDALALGAFTLVSGRRSTAIGYSTTARGFATTVVGQFNAIDAPNPTTWITTDPLFILGNGTGLSTDAPHVKNSNAFVVYKNGNAELSGDLKVRGRDVVTTATGGTSTFLGGIEAPRLGVGTGNPLATVHLGPEGWPGGNDPIAIFSKAATGDNSLLFTRHGVSAGVIGLDLTNTFNISTEAGRGGIDFRTAGDYAAGLTSGTSRLKILDNGNVGIGTPAPRAKLEVVGSVIQRYWSEAPGSMGFGSYYEGSPGGIIAGMEVEHQVVNGGMSNRVHFGTHLYGHSNARRMTIDYNGSIGVGTPAPQAKLHVAGDAKFDGVIRTSVRAGDIRMFGEQ